MEEVTISTINISIDNAAHGSIYTYSDDPKSAYISNIMVDNKSTKQGLGNKVMRILEGIAILMSVSDLYLIADTTSFVFGWYKRIGFNTYRQVANDTTKVNTWMHKNIIK